MRFYPAPDGRPLAGNAERSLPSVTTILDATMPHDQRARLDLHYANSPNALMHNAEARRRGNAVDAWVKAYLWGGNCSDIDAQFMPYFLSVQPLLDALKVEAQVTMSDRIVYDLARGYAGTLDLALLQNGKLTIIDVKTKNFYYQPQIEDALVQVTAYGEALQTEGYEIGAIACLWCSAKRSKLIRVNDPELMKLYSDAWSERLAAFPGVMAEAV